ncbi:MAG: redoxin domain-containing protein [Armatimonadota bacterium]
MNDTLVGTIAGTEDHSWRVLYFWSTSCPCVRRCEQDTLFPLSRKYKNKGVRFYAVASNAANVRYVQPTPSASSGNPSAETAVLDLPGPMEKSEKPPFPILVDAHHKIADALHATNTPETFLIDPRGRVVFRGDPDDSAEQLVKTGRERITRRYLASALERALAGKKVLVPVSPTSGCHIDRSDVPDKPEKAER